MIQGILVILVFCAATVYLGRLIYRSIHSDSCESGCGKCSTLDLDKIEKSIREKEMLLH